MGLVLIVASRSVLEFRALTKTPSLGTIQSNRSQPLSQIQMVDSNTYYSLSRSTWRQWRASGSVARKRLLGDGIPQYPRVCGLCVFGVTLWSKCDLRCNRDRRRGRICTVGDGTWTSERSRRANKANKTVFAGAQRRTSVLVASVQAHVRSCWTSTENNNSKGLRVEATTGGSAARSVASHHVGYDHVSGPVMAMSNEQTPATVAAPARQSRQLDLEEV
jgi:hypothetical protein